MKTVTTRKSTNVRKYLELATWRTMFALGGVFMPSVTADHAARLFATPFASARNRARAFESNDVVSRADFHRGSIAAGARSLSTYVWGDPTRERYALLVHGWSSFGLRFASWVARLRAAGYAVVAFDHPAHGNSNGTLATLPEFAEAVSAVGVHFGNAALAIGHSLGGAAIMLAQDERWRAERIVLIAPPADMTMAVDRYFRFLRLGDHLRGRFYAWHQQRTGVDARTLSLAQRLRAFGQPGLDRARCRRSRSPVGRGRTLRDALERRASADDARSRPQPHPRRCARDRCRARVRARRNRRRSCAGQSRLDVTSGTCDLACDSRRSRHHRGDRMRTAIVLRCQFCCRVSSRPCARKMSPR